MKKRIAVLGSTGSIGRQVLDVVSAFPSLFRITGLATKGYPDIFKNQVKQFSPKRVSISDVETDNAGMKAMAQDPSTDVVVMSIVGTAGLPTTLAAIKKGKTIALASKEILVAAGEVVMAEAKKYGARILPLDSEHSAVFQCLQGHRVQGAGCRRNESLPIPYTPYPAPLIKRIILTASGGPFRKYSKKQLSKVTA
ncbi:MAG: hypothetical protein AABZ57_01140, partial [Candidatus Margulisiibacteriota bacterium]